MTSIRTRPRFWHQSAQSIEQLKLNIKNYAGNHPSDGVSVMSYDQHCSFTISQSERHFWSPQLNLTFEENDDGCIIRGRYGPSPTIWPFFLFGYGALGTSFVFIGLFGLSQLALKQSAPILWALPFLLIGILAIWLIGQFGQKIGAEHTFRIHRFVEDSVGERIHIH